MCFLQPIRQILHNNVHNSYSGKSRVPSEWSKGGLVVEEDSIDEETKGNILSLLDKLDAHMTDNEPEAY